MQYNTQLLIVSLAVLFCLCDTTNAFTTNFVSPIVDVPQRQKQQMQRVRTATTLSHHSSIYQTIVSEEGRRDFLKQLSTAITGASLTPLLLPQLAYADDNEDDATTIDKVETILKDESELDNEVIQEEEDEKKSIEDEEQLINELEKEISIEESDTSTPEEIEEEASKVRGETEALIEEEEKLLNEAEEIISKIESIESEVQSLDEVDDKSNNGDDATTSTETTSEEFVEKLKERVERKEDLITRLKRHSENDIDTKTGKKRSFSIANAPEQEGFIELHIRRVAGGEFSEYMWNTMKEREIFRFTGPLGSFFLREDSDKPILFLATGTGFAPIKGIVEHALAKNTQREMVLYWGCRSLEDLYMPNLPSEWQQAYPNFTFIPVLSEPKPEDAWQGRTGFLHEVVLEDFNNLKNFQVYACGAPVMVEAAYTSFVAHQLPADEFFSDAFFSSKDVNQ